MTDATLWTAWHALDIERRRVRRMPADDIDRTYEQELTDALREIATNLDITPEPEGA